MRAGDVLGSYVIIRELGSGGMGTVYLAEHTTLGRQAAIKVLQPELTSNQLMLTRFFNEARAASAIKSPGIVEIYDFGRHPDGSAYIVMELLEGEPLAARLARLKRLPLGNALVIARQIASALAPAHRAGIVHRDLKPDNVFLVPDAEVAGGERVKLLDFGIAKLLGDDEPGGAGRLTTTKTVMGTPHYMSPEQCRGAGGVDARSDLYALGCMLHELVSGHPPFVGEGAGDLIGAHIYLPPRPLTQTMPELPVEVDELVQRLLAKQAGQRPQSADEVAAALSALASRFSASYSAPTLVPQGHRAATMEHAPNAANAGTPMAVAPVRHHPTAVMKSGRSRVAMGAVLALVAAVAIYAAVRAGADGSRQLAQAPDPGEAGRGSDGSAPDAGAPMPIVAPDAARAVVQADAAAVIPPQAPDASTTPPVNDDVVVKRKRSECATMQSDERWAELKKCAGELRALKGTSPEDVTAAADFARQSGVETASKAQLDKFLAAQKADDMRGMAAIARNFDKTSMYAQQVQQQWESEKGTYVAGKAAQARNAARSGKCGELRNLATSVRAYDAGAADEISGMSCTAGTATPAVDCDDPAVSAAAEKLFNEIQSARVSDPKATIRMVEMALANKCLASKKHILVRIGVVAACTEKRPDKVMFFFSKSKDQSLVTACPEYLGDVVK
jgi:tRNA A-37 threonylcarbamoyl transferase component Bud32